MGRAIGQAVSRRLPTSVARIRFKARSRGICGGQSGTGTSFLRVLGFPCQFLFHQLIQLINNPIIEAIVLILTALLSNKLKTIF
jgi:hypothetical protein